MSPEIIIAISSSVGTILTAIPFTWLLSLRYHRRKAKYDADGSALDFVQKEINIFKELFDAQNREIGILKTQVKTLETEIHLIKPMVCYKTDCKNRIKAST